MPVDAIGGGLQQSQSLSAGRTTVNQEDFIRLFLAQLQFQDPLEPMDNREFLAQLASFSSLEQARQTSQGVDNLLFMTSGGQALDLLNRVVEVRGVSSTTTGTVIAVSFTSSGPELSVRPADGNVITGVRLAQVALVTP